VGWRRTGYASSAFSFSPRQEEETPKSCCPRCGENRRECRNLQEAQVLLEGFLIRLRVEILSGRENATREDLLYR
jgi:hypothetical protein